MRSNALAMPHSERLTRFVRVPLGAFLFCFSI
jgi:hypothetical protein